MKENRPCALISSGQPIPKRGGPLITIRTSTFVELLGQSRGWDAKFPALAGVSRAYLLESFTFDDAFCAYATEAERRRFAMEEVIGGRRLTRCGRESGQPEADRRVALTVKRLILCAALLLVLLPASSVRAQGNDFPFYPNVPPWNQPFIPAPVPGLDYNWGSTAWGPQTLWGVQKGSTVVFDIVLDWYGLGPLSLSAMSSNGQNMRWNGPNTRAGQWYHPGIGFWCLRCEFQFEAGDDNPDLWIAFMGSEQFGLHAEIKQVIPPLVSPRDVVSQQKKDAARDKANRQNNWSAGLGLLAAPTCNAFAWELCVAVTAMSLAFQLDANRLNNIANDPWDGDYPYEYGPVWNFYPVPYQQLSEDYSVSPLGMASYINRYMYYVTLVDGLDDMAYVSANRCASAAQVGDYGSADMQCGRTDWALQRAGVHYGDIATDLRNFAWFFATYYDPYIDVGSGEKYLSDSVTQMAASYDELSAAFQQ